MPNKNFFPAAVFMSMLLLTFILLFTGNAVCENREYLHHNLDVSLSPTQSFIRVTDEITFPSLISTTSNTRKIHFLLHGNLSITSISPNATYKKEKGELKSEFFGINTPKFEIKDKIPINHYSITFYAPEPGTSGSNGESLKVTISYEGKIHHPVEKVGGEYARGFSETPGIISEEGVFLAGASFWVPWFNNNLVTFQLKTLIAEPSGWDVVSQGKRTLHESTGDGQSTAWVSPEPMDEVYLIGAKFKEYSLKVGKVNVLAFLRTPDDNLANKYLETTGQYLELYEKLIGPYPYDKFALVENFWETGYGMPSFTLLGPQVIRFPFILHSSYPHELLHNYWGNSVFVDYETGNWCEGLTVYLADYLIKEQWGQAEEYRKTTLQDYTHYAAGKKKEFPLKDFKSRYDSLSSSIGYGKSMMVFHMIRQAIGDDLFKKAIAHFYKDNLYKRASFDDLRKAFETVSNRDLKSFFAQWINRTGIPAIRIDNTSVTVKPIDNRFSVSFSISQVQSDPAYTLTVPVAFYFSPSENVEPVVKMVELTAQNQAFEFTFDRQPVIIDCDPQYNVLRKLHPNEIPPTLSNVFGSREILIILPSAARPEFREGYKKLAETWAKEGEEKIEIKWDKDISSLPAGKAVWVLGWENRYRDKVKKSLSFYRSLTAMDDNSVLLEKNSYSPQKASIIIGVKNEKDPARSVILLSADNVKALPGLGRKLPHYGKYSYLIFEGEEPTNTVKGQWPTVDSPLTAMLSPTGDVEKGRSRLKPSSPLERLAPLFSSERMMNHVQYLASPDLEGRAIGSKGIEKSAHYIATAFNKAGLLPGGDSNTYYQTWPRPGIENDPVPLRNVIAVLPGTNPAYSNQSVIVCAHYDHLGSQFLGADDNASGVSVLLELAQTFAASYKPERTIVFIAFTGEETRLLGSSHFVEKLPTTDKNYLKNIMAVVNLDTVGRFNLQNKLMVIGGSSAREWRFIFMGVGFTTGIQSEMIQQELDSSDQVSFIKAHIPGIQVTTGPHFDYHKPTDTADKIDAPGLVKVATAAREVLVYLAERKEPLTTDTATPTSSTSILTSTSTSTSTSASPTLGSPAARSVKTGLMPDFTYTGKGVKIGAVSPGSAAEKAGLQKDDIIIRVGTKEIETLKGYSEILKTFKPGDAVVFIYLRGGTEYSTTVTFTPQQ